MQDHFHKIYQINQPYLVRNFHELVKNYISRENSNIGANLMANPWFFQFSFYPFCYQNQEEKNILRTKKDKDDFSGFIFYFSELKTATGFDV